jgi:hypothetical protein
MSVGVMKDYKLKTKEFTRLPYDEPVIDTHDITCCLLPHFFTTGNKEVVRPKYLG